MASATTERKTYKQESGKTATVADMQAHSDLAKDLDEEDNWGLLVEDDGILGGLDLEFSSGNTFNINAGLAIMNGQVLKDTGSPQSQVTLDNNTDPSNTRIDMISISGHALSETDSSTDKVVEPTTVTDLTGVAIGTANGVDTEFDLTKYNVIARTVKIYVGGTRVAGWVFDPEEGAANVAPLPNNDGIKFDSAPSSGAITADFSHVVGGYEVTPGAGYNTRWQWNIDYVVTKGTPGGPAASLPANHLEVGKITVPASWAGGSSGVSIDHEDKIFILARDQINDDTGHSAFDRPARVSDLIRGMQMVRHGCRLYYAATDQIALTPGFLNSHGIAMVHDGRSTVTKTLTTTETPTTGWYPVFAVPEGNNTSGVGKRPVLFVGGSSVTWIGSDDTSPLTQAGTIFLSWVYVTVSGSTVTLRRFRSDNDGWVYWDVAPGLLSINNGSYADIDLSAWCPPGCKKVDVEVIGSLNNAAGSPDDTASVNVRSQKTSSTVYSQYPEINILWEGNSTAIYQRNARGILRPEDVSGVPTLSGECQGGGSGTVSANLKVLGFYQDLTAYNSSGSALTY